MSGGPEVVAHQPAGLVVHLPPHRGRVDLAAQPAQVDLDHRVPVAFGVGLDPAVGRHDPQRIAVADQQPAAVAGDVVAVQLARPASPSGASRSPSAAASAGCARRRPVAWSSPSRPACGVSSQTRPPRTARRPRGPGGRDRHRDHPLVDRLRVHQHRLRRRVGAAAVTATAAAAALTVVGGRPTGRLGVERGRRGRAERHQVRPGAAEEGQVEDPVVVDRVEACGWTGRPGAARRG